MEKDHLISASALSDQVTRDYNILRLLGKGGMGEVYLAEQLRVGRRRVALKVLSRACSEDPEIVKRFENEAASAGRIHHNNVVMIYESRVTDDGQICVVMEYVEGKSLRQEVGERGALPLEELVEIARQLCAGLNIAHKLGIVHRDIKPDNIMLARDEQDSLVVKVLDFGIARLSEPGEDGVKTKSGVIMGTPYYMSPEQALGNTGDKIDARSDIYSVGMVVYQMLTGRVAFESDSWMRVMYKHINEQPLPPSQFRAEMASFQEIERVVLKSLEKDRENRQKSVVEFSTELEAAYSLGKARRSDAPTVIYDPTIVSAETPFTSAAERLAATTTASRKGPAVSDVVEAQHANGSFITESRGLSRRTVIGAVVIAALMIAVIGVFVLVRPSTESAVLEAASAAPSIRPSPMPAIQTFAFDVLTLNPTGQISNIRKTEGRYFGEDLGGGVAIEMVEIPAGSYLMGARLETQQDRQPNERPQHTVTLPGFFMSRIEVTQVQWLLVSKLPKIKLDLDANPSGFKGDTKLPVQNVSWGEAIEFCERLSRATGRKYRLPTEAQWEYSCRAGTTTPFYFGPTITAEFVNYDANYPFGGAPKGMTRKTPVSAGSMAAPNSFGLNNMHGNMAEWCMDLWHDNYVGAPTDGRSWEDGGNESLRVFRGGSWYDGGDNCRSAFRNHYAPDVKLSFIGLRIVMIPQ
jgi:eukaryotic-like serine/threonine-protein kinase